jgi:hypothetical protein
VFRSLGPLRAAETSVGPWNAFGPSRSVGEAHLELVRSSFSRGADKKLDVKLRSRWDFTYSVLKK